MPETRHASREISVPVGLLPHLKALGDLAAQLPMGAEVVIHDRSYIESEVPLARAFRGPDNKPRVKMIQRPEDAGPVKITDEMIERAARAWDPSAFEQPVGDDARRQARAHAAAALHAALNGDARA